VRSQQDNLKTAKQFRSLADQMTERIQEKRNPAVARLRATRRRARITSHMRDEADQMERLRAALYGLADAHETGTVPPILADLRYKTELRLLVHRSTWPWEKDDQERLERRGITEGTYGEARAALQNLARSLDHSEQCWLQEMETKADLLIGQVPGFFPTPEDLAARMVRLAAIEPGMDVLEHSGHAGEHVGQTGTERGGARTQPLPAAGSARPPSLRHPQDRVQEEMMETTMQSWMLDAARVVERCVCRGQARQGQWRE
jgi:hypothetical protein